MSEPTRRDIQSKDYSLNPALESEYLPEFEEALAWLLGLSTHPDEMDERVKALSARAGEIEDYRKRFALGMTLMALIKVWKKMSLSESRRVLKTLLFEIGLGKVERSSSGCKRKRIADWTDSVSVKAFMYSLHANPSCSCLRRPTAVLPNGEQFLFVPAADDAESQQVQVSSKRISSRNNSWSTSWRGTTVSISTSSSGDFPLDCAQVSSSSIILHRPICALTSHNQTRDAIESLGHHFFITVWA